MLGDTSPHAAGSDKIVVIRLVDDEHVEVEVDGVTVAEAVYDEHGWADVTVRLDRALGANIRIEEGRSNI